MSLHNTLVAGSDVVADFSLRGSSESDAKGETKICALHPFGITNFSFNEPSRLPLQQGSASE